MTTNLNQRVLDSVTLSKALTLGTLLFAVLLSTGCTPASSQQDTDSTPRIAIAIHGGAGAMARERSTPERDAVYEAKLSEALDAGYAVLEGGGTSMDAVIAAITLMEDAPEFNAGKGAVFTAEGTVELDASIMDGASRNAGAIAGVTRVRNPITLARLVMESSPHVMMVGEGAETFASSYDVPMVENSYFQTDRRRAQLERIQAETSDAETSDAETSDAQPSRSPSEWVPSPSSNPLPDLYSEPIEQKYGTVGAVALDQHGNLAAGTSTGGMMNKQFGRVGDAPIIGAGTYADNATAAISATGHGEYFIRSVLAFDIAATMAYTGATVQDAAYTVIMDKLTEFGGTGGVIALDRQGNVAMPFNTAGMYRASIDAAGNRVVRIYKDADYE